MSARVLFITGTVAGAGKTLFSVALLRRLRTLNTAAIGVKPVETGCVYGEDHDLIAHDGDLLHRAAHRSAPPLAVGPYRFVGNVAPALAAERAGIELQLDDLVTAVEGLARFGEPLVIESEGAALSPLASDGLVLDLAERLSAPILVIAPDRLGAESEVIGVLEAARRRALPILGCILSRHDADDAVLDALDNVRLIRERGGVTVFATIPRLSGDEDAMIAAVEEHLAEHAIAEALLDAADRP